jgi:hypothetical protein
LLASLPAGHVDHAINRGVARRALFEKEGDLKAFERVRVEAVNRTDTRLLGRCLMPSHWHFVLWPRADLGRPTMLHSPLAHGRAPEDRSDSSPGRNVTPKNGSRPFASPFLSRDSPMANRRPA